MPIDKVSSISPSARAAARISRNIRNCARWSADLGRRCGDAHEAAQCEPRQRDDGARERKRVAGRDAAFARLGADVDLHANVERTLSCFTCSRQSLGNGHPVDGFHPRELRRRGARLVPLQRSDQMPFDVRQIGQRGHLGRRLLHVVLAEGALPERMDGPDRLRRHALAHGEQPDRRRIATRGVGRPRDALLHGLPRLLV